MENNTRHYLRKQILLRRSTLTARQQQYATRIISQKIIQLPNFLKSQRIAFYFHAKGEVGTDIVLQQAFTLKKECYLPILHPIKHDHMFFGHYQANDPLKINRFGILEPKIDGIKKIHPWMLDLVFMPLVAFDANGNRLGMGAGYYDRTFSFLSNSNHHKPLLIGLAYDFQQLPSIPTLPWDIPLDMIVTESDTILTVK